MCSFLAELLDLEPLQARALLAAGALGPSFGDGGTVLTDFGTTLDKAVAVAIQTDGKLVAAGSAGGDFALARYDPDGSLDATFGTADVDGRDNGQFGRRLDTTLPG